MSDGWILLCEDNPDDEELALLALEEAGVANEVRIARDGVEALEAFAGGDLPIVVLLDLKMPRLDGFQVLERLRADPRTRLLPVVILTSSDLDEDVVRGYELGVNSYVRKPVEFSEFAAAVRNLGLYWSLLNLRPRPEREADS